MRPLYDSETNADGQHPSLHVVCERRRAELVLALEQLGPDGSPRTRRDIGAALEALDGLLTGGRDRMPIVVVEQLTRWLESSKYLGAKEARERAAAPPARRGGLPWTS